MIVTIDGPAGAGKSSIAKRLAMELDFDFLDTGAMYRAITLGIIRSHLEWEDVPGLIEFSRAAVLRWEGEQIFLNDQDVSQEIRTPTVTSAIHFVADLPEIRCELTNQQRRIACDLNEAGRGIVTDGRDQGSEVFPNAQCKIFLTASPEERARRRQEQLSASGRFLPLDEVLVTQNRRDKEDTAREVGALRPADDATIVETDGMTPDEVIQKVLSIVQQCSEYESPR
ncbi:Cytidylate kinase [Rubripirellula obstinata]|uniref:Cytidylate kinase n=1 Tax=Rubripirellula obstinata TaxID=406547 RepID=A0A5B1CT38_9BACT|nr:(d)CMP kinase [Rubripirellula obstinata]KAA1262384.1 Cytidylate kinase [Rubripirellula obstinata]